MCPYYYWKYDCSNYRHISWVFIPFLHVDFAGWCWQLSKLLQLTIIHLSETFENMALQLKYRIFFTVENIWFYIFHFLQLFFLRDKYMFKETAVKKNGQSVGRWRNIWAQILRAAPGTVGGVDGEEGPASNAAVAKGPTSHWHIALRQGWWISCVSFVVQG